MTTPFDSSNTAPLPPSGLPQATVTFQPIAWDFTNNTLVQDPSSYNQGVFVDYAINNRFENSKQIYMNGVAAPGGFNGQTAVFCQLTASTLLLVVDWTASKAGAKPQIPDPASKNSNWVFLYELYEPSHLELDGTGNSVIYRISGCYVYGAKNGNKSQTDYLSWPIPPWMSTSVDRTFESSMLTQNLSMNNGGGGTTGDAGGPGYFVGNGG